jgi:hypothetical protein
VTDESPDAEAGRSGQRVVLALYAILVAVSGVGGVLVSTFVDDLAGPELFGVIALPPTPLGFAAFGAVTIAVVLGVPLALVVVVSARVDDPHAVDDEP